MNARRELNLDRMAQIGTQPFKVKIFYGQMDFDLDQCLKTLIIKLNDMSRGFVSELTKRTPMMRTRYADDAVVFYREDKQIH